MGTGIDPEWAALVAGLKPAIRVTVDPGHEADVAARFRGQGLAVVHAATTVKMGGRDAAIVYVARAETDAALLRDAEARALPGHVVTDLAADLDAHREIGRRLGFPRCCTEAYCGRVRRGVDRLDAAGPSGLAEDYVAAREAWVARPNARINNLLFTARLKLVSFYPCRYDCEVAGRYADALRAVIARRDAASARAIDTGLGRHVAIAPSNARALVTMVGAQTIGADPTIATAEAPRDASGRVVHEADVAFAAQLVGKGVTAAGEVTGTASGARPAAWVIAFGA